MECIRTEGGSRAASQAMAMPKLVTEDIFLRSSRHRSRTKFSSHSYAESARDPTKRAHTTSVGTRTSMSAEFGEVHIGHPRGEEGAVPAVNLRFQERVREIGSDRLAGSRRIRRGRGNDFEDWENSPMEAVPIPPNHFRRKAFATRRASAVRRARNRRDRRHVRAARMIDKRRVRAPASVRRIAVAVFGAADDACTRKSSISYVVRIGIDLRAQQVRGGSGSTFPVFVNCCAKDCRSPSVRASSVIRPGTSRAGSAGSRCRRDPFRDREVCGHRFDVGMHLSRCVRPARSRRGRRPKVEMRRPGLHVAARTFGIGGLAPDTSVRRFRRAHGKSSM